MSLRARILTKVLGSLTKNSRSAASFTSTRQYCTDSFSIGQQQQQQRKNDSYRGDDRVSFCRVNKKYMEKFDASSLTFLSRLNLNVSELNALITTYIDLARKAGDEDIFFQRFNSAYGILESMRLKRLKIGEETYSPFLRLFIDNGMMEEFDFLYRKILSLDPNAISRLGYYQMVSWIKFGCQDKIHSVISNTDESIFYDSYLVALFEGNRQKEALTVLDAINMKSYSSRENLEVIFKWLGRLSLESYVKKFILELTGNAGPNISNLIYIYATNLPNIEIEDMVARFNLLHAELKVPTSFDARGKLMRRASCDSLEVGKI